MGLIVGIVLIVVFTLLLAAALLFIRSVFVRWLLAVIVPVLVCAAVYWSAVWTGGDESEYSAWSGLIIGAWYLPSYLVAMIFIYKTRAMLGFRRQSQISAMAIGEMPSLFGREFLGFLVAILVQNLLYADMNPSDGWFSLGLLTLFTGAWLGFPSYFLFKCMGWLGFWRITLAGALLGLVVAMWFTPLTLFAFSASEWRDTIRVPGFLCMSGAAAGAAFWLVALARFKRGPRETSPAGL